MTPPRGFEMGFNLKPKTVRARLSSKIKAEHSKHSFPK